MDITVTTKLAPVTIPPPRNASLSTFTSTPCSRPPRMGPDRIIPTTLAPQTPPVIAHPPRPYSMCHPIAPATETNSPGSRDFLQTPECWLVKHPDTPGRFAACSSTSSTTTTSLRLRSDGCPQDLPNSTVLITVCPTSPTIWRQPSDRRIEGRNNILYYRTLLIVGKSPAMRLPTAPANTRRFVKENQGLATTEQCASTYPAIQALLFSGVNGLQHTPVHRNPGN